MIPPYRRRSRSLFEIWQQPRPYQESLVPMSGPDAPAPVKPNAGPEITQKAPKEDPALLVRPPSIELSTKGPWGPWTPNKNASPEKQEKTFDIAPAFDDDAYKSQVEELLKKGYYLPSEFQSPIKGIAQSANNILACMRNDPADVPEGDRFLRRYLKSTITLIDSWRKIVSSDPQKDRKEKITTETLSMLRRLEAAFLKKHSDLLANDVLDLSADINTIDKLLKMEGH